MTDMESGVEDARMSFGDPYETSVLSPSPSVIIVCEHASHHIPRELSDLGVSAEAAQSHVAWDPGALGVAESLAQRLPSVLVQGTLSRLVYDCNRPPDSVSAIPIRSEVYDIPGNQDLSTEARAQRVAGVYEPFRRALSEQIDSHRGTLDLLVTIHSFTPIYNGVPRDVEIGLLHGLDNEFAQAMLSMVPQHTQYDIRLNQPYSARDGVAHTLDLHGAGNGLQNVMIEIRNDLIKTETEQDAMGSFLADWLQKTRAVLSKQERAV